jgi:hypothetical protein
MNHHQANVEPLNIFEFLLTVLLLRRLLTHVQVVDGLSWQKAIRYLRMGQQPSKQKEL